MATIKIIKHVPGGLSESAETNLWPLQLRHLHKIHNLLLALSANKAYDCCEVTRHNNLVHTKQYPGKNNILSVFDLLTFRMEGLI